MESATIRNHEFFFFKELHFSTESIKNHPATYMVGAGVYATSMFLMGSIVGIPYHWATSPSNSVTGFKDLLNPGTLVGATAVSALVFLDKDIQNYGSTEILKALYDSTVFSIEAWPQVIAHEALDLIGNLYNLD